MRESTAGPGPGTSTRARDLKLSAARLLERDFAALVLGEITPGNPGVMRKHGQPTLRNGAGVVALAALDGFQGIEIEGHDPVKIQVRARGNQVGDVAGGCAAVLDD